jgi:hypothetical protein
MLSFPAAIKVYLYTVACDIRRSFDGLSMMAEHIIRCNPRRLARVYGGLHRRYTWRAAA